MRKILDQHEIHTVTRKTLSTEHLFFNIKISVSKKSCLQDLVTFNKHESFKVFWHITYGNYSDQDKYFCLLWRKVSLLVQRMQVDPNTELQARTTLTISFHLI